MTTKRMLLAAGVSAAAAAIGAASVLALAPRAPAPPKDIDGHSVSWTRPVTRWSFDALSPNRYIIVHRDTGVVGQHDDTKTITVTDATGNPLTTHSSHWQTISLRRLVPDGAKVALLSVKSIITKGQRNGLATVYVFVRKHGTNPWPSPREAPGYPVDFALPPHGAEAESIAVATAQLPGDGQRQWSDFVIPLVGDTFDWAWGYRRVDGTWPDGDAVGFEMHLNGYGY